MPSFNLQQFDIIQCNVAGLPAFMEGSVTIDRSTNSVPAKTVLGGYSGETRGSPMTEVTMENLIPVAGFDLVTLAMQAAMDSLIPIAFSFYMGANEYTFSGFVVNESLSGAVDTESKNSFKARGTYTSFIPLVGP